MGNAESKASKVQPTTLKQRISFQIGINKAEADFNEYGELFHSFEMGSFEMRGYNSFCGKKFKEYLDDTAKQNSF